MENNRKLLLVQVAIIAFVSVAVHFPVFYGPFLFDDVEALLKNADVQVSLKISEMRSL